MRIYPDSCSEPKILQPSKSSAILHKAQQLYNVNDRLDSLAERHPLLEDHSVPGWGRMIFYVADVDAFWERLR
jgi:hypothetical protein